MNIENQQASGEVSIGVTGHRILAEPARISAGIKIAVDRTLGLFPRRTITVFSSLAEGSDRLIVREMLTRPGTRLIVPLPMPKSKYIEDFSSSESKQEFIELLSQATKIIELASMPTLDASYASAGQYILDHSQLLIAVWDGQLEQGEGGTGAIVAQCRARELPLAWIHAGNRTPGTSRPTTLGTEQGSVTFERFERTASSSSDLSSLVQRAINHHDSRAVKLQKKRLTFALVTTALGPVAVSLLATQVQMFPTGGLGARVLIAMELGLLAWTLAISFLSIGRSHKDWIKERLRAEILRREQFLLFGQVGPYLNLPSSSLASRVQERLLHIQSDVRDPLELLLMKDRQTSWRESLEDASSAGPLPLLPDLPSKIRRYLDHRVTMQRTWFSSKGRSHDSLSRFFENGAKIILMLALIVAALHLGLLVESRQENESRLLHRILIIMAISLPAVGGAFVGLQSIIGSERLSHSYRYHAEVLESIETLLMGLLRQLESPNPPPLQEIQFRLMRSILNAEELLSHELRQWWLVMHPTPRAGP